MAGMFVRVGGAWKKVKQPYVRVGGAWKKVTNAYVRVGGAWKRFYQRGIEVAVTAANNGTNTFRGFLEGQYGSASPTDLSEALGGSVTLIQIGCFTGTGFLRVVLNSLPVTGFTVETSTGTYNSNEATVTPIGSPLPTSWQFDWAVDAGPFNSQTVLFSPAS